MDGSPPTSVRFVGYAVGALGVVVLAATVAGRIASPWPLEWMEGATLHHALRLTQGRALYAAPSAEFIPFVYPPLAYLPMAASMLMFGPSLWACRLVSVLALAGCLACAFVSVRRTTGSAAAGCWATGVYALGFGYGGAFGDLARVDSVFMLLVWLAIERFSARDTRLGLLWLALSCFAKQHGLIFFGAVGLAIAMSDAWRARRVRGRLRGWVFTVAVRQLLAAAAVVITGQVALQLATGGGYYDYVFAVPRGHGLVPALLASYFAVDVVAYLPVLAAFIVIGSGGARGCEWARALGGGRMQLGFALLAAGLVAAALGRAHPGGDDNVRLPGFAVLVFCAAVALPSLSAAAKTGVRRGVLAGALVLQPLLLLQLPAAHAPSARSAREFAELRAALQRCSNGDLAQAVALDHALFTGRPWVHTMALSDLRKSAESALAHAGTQALIAALSRADAPQSVAVSVSFPELDRVLAQRYTPCAQLPALRLATGYALAPTRVYQRAKLR